MSRVMDARTIAALTARDTGPKCATEVVYVPRDVSRKAIVNGSAFVKQFIHNARPIDVSLFCPSRASRRVGL